MVQVLRRLLAHPRFVVAVWGAVLLACAPFAIRLRQVARGGSEAIRGSESHAVMATLEREFGRGMAHLVPVVVSSAGPEADDPAFARVVASLTEALVADPAVHGVTHPWNSGLPELRGRDGASVLLLVQPNAGTLAEAEEFTFVLRNRIEAAGLPGDFQAHVTGLAAMFADLNRQSSADLLRAEAIGIPLTLIVLLLVFRSPLAAGMALAVAISAVTVSSAALCLLDPWVPAGVFAQNVISMIGLGAGTDYALFLLSHYRSERLRESGTDAALRWALGRCVPAIVFSGLAVAGGFAALFAVNAQMLHSLAVGGIIVVLVALAATVTLLPALMQLAGDRLHRAQPGGHAQAAMWERWARLVMRRPWLFLAAALAVTALFAWPARRAEGWNFGADDLPLTAESRRGYEKLAADFAPGWMGPVVITARHPNGWWHAGSRPIIESLTAELRRDPHVAHVLGFPRTLDALGPGFAGFPPGAPPSAADFGRMGITPDGRTASIVVVLRHPPDTAESASFVSGLRQHHGGGSIFAIGGATAMMQDFDREMTLSLITVVLVVVALTFVLLFAFFRSVAVPLKAIAANLVSVVAAYGFLVLVFQDGLGAGILGLDPPGGLNSFVVLMLFTILFGLSMDYEIFLLSGIRDEQRAGADNTTAVARGLASTAGVITSAAAVMVCLFGSFSFFGLVATREFGLGLAFAVAFDVTVIRLLVVPAAMRLLGEWNWWPGVRLRGRAEPGTSPACRPSLSR